MKHIPRIDGVKILGHLAACGLALWLPVHTSLADGNSTEPPRYTVNRTAISPVIDGFVAPGEWIGASTAAGNFVDSVTHAEDAHGLRFQLLWDDTHLYILGQTDFANFAPAENAFFNPDEEGGSYTHYLYFDPNRDAEDLDAVSTMPDAYQITWEMNEGVAARRPTEGQPDQALRNPLDESGEPIVDYMMGMKLEARINSTTLADNAGWSREDGANNNYRDDDHPEIVIAQRADNLDLNGSEAPGGLFEMSIAWSEFNATDPSGSFAENGLFLEQPPIVGDVWAFEMAAITNDPSNLTPSWSEPLGGNPSRSFNFAVAPHGRLEFSEFELSPLDCNADGLVNTDDILCSCATGMLPDLLTELQLLPGDFDANGIVGFSDFVTLASNFGKPVEGYANGDVNCDMLVGFQDFVRLASNFGKSFEVAGETSVASVPEPTSGLAIAALALISFARRGRRSRIG